MNDSSAGGVPTCYRHSARESHITCQRCRRPICPDCMREASVGYQCPACVAEGRREMRPTVTRFGGRPSANPALTSFALIATNVLVWLGVTATGGHTSKLADVLAIQGRGTCEAGANAENYYPNVHTEAGCSGVPDGVWHPGVSDGAPWQVLTSAFTHIDLLHLLVNMVALYFLGPQLEMLLGRARFVALYLISAIAGSAAVLWLAGPDTSSLGASGAIFGMLGAMVMLFLKLRAGVQSLLMWLGINVVITFTAANISWQGHLGGLIGGLLCGIVLGYAPGTASGGRGRLQWAGLAVVGALALTACAVRALIL